MSGVKKMLAQGVANEQALLKKAAKTAADMSVPNPTPVLPEPEVIVSDSVDSSVEKETVAPIGSVETVRAEVVATATEQTKEVLEPAQVDAKEATKPVVKKTKEKGQSKNLGGRPTNQEKGLALRKQYTLTLKEETYQRVLERAAEEEISFARYMERAVLKYMEQNM